MITKKIAVITLPGYYNYGNRLQAFAVHRIYEKLGYGSDFLVLRKRERLQTLVQWIKRLVGFPLEDPQKMSSPARLKAFLEFSRQIPERVVNSIAEIECDEYAWFSCGSDQVWNPGIVSPGMGQGVLQDAYHKVVNPGRISNLVEWYYLGFCPKDKRIALAPSIGLDELDGDRVLALKHGVENFDKISIREAKGRELILDCTGKTAEVICDPTLVLDADEWRSVARDAMTPKDSYVFTYLLGGVGSEAAEVLEQVTCHGDKPTVPLSDRQKSGEPDAGPAEFISLIDHADHVVTDSFHAAVFASILQTPLTIVHREGGASMFSRLEQLSQTLGIEHKVFGSPDFDFSRAGDYRGVPEAIGRERDKFMSYLESCLNA